MIKPLFTINDWSLLSCGTELSTPGWGLTLSTRSQRSPRASPKLGFKKGLLEKDGCLKPWLKLWSCQWCCCLFWDAEQEGMCEVSQALTVNTHTQSLVQQIKERKHLLERKHSTAPSAILHPCWLLQSPSPWVGGSQLPPLCPGASRDTFLQGRAAFPTNHVLSKVP